MKTNKHLETAFERGDGYQQLCIDESAHFSSVRDHISHSFDTVYGSNKQTLQNREDKEL